MMKQRLQTIWVILKSIGIMVYHCVRTIVIGLLGSRKRKDIDQEISTWARKLLNAAKVDYQVHNPHQINLKDGKRYILMCNHCSHYDIPLSIMSFPNDSIRMLAKKELARVPFMGKAMQAAEFPFVDRENPRQAVKDLQKVKQLLEDGIAVWIAPEGTRSPTGNLGKLKSGGFITAIKAKAMIVPIGINGSFNILPPKTWQFHLHQQVTITIGQAIDASQYTLNNRQPLIDHLAEQLKLLAANDLASNGNSQ